MAGLINGRAVLTTTGHLTESVWAETEAVALAPARDTGSQVAAALTLLSRDEARGALAARGERVYRERFALDHTIRALRGAVEARPHECRSPHDSITTRDWPPRRALPSLAVIAPSPRSPFRRCSVPAGR
jgi:hypothetical protein